MERLTNIGSNGEVWITDNDETRKFGRKETACKKLAEYEDADEQGLLLRLPCKVGDTVYKIINQRDNFDDKPYKIVTAVEFRLSMFGEIGKTVFLSKTDAEQKLKGEWRECVSQFRSH